MGREIINTGTTLNDGTGDSLSTGGAKINRMTAELYQKLTQRIIVGQSGHFSTIAAAITWLGTGSNMTGATEILLDAGSHLVTDTIVVNLGHHLSIRGFDGASASINASTGLTNKPMFQLVSSCWINRTGLNATTLSGYGTGATENSIEIIGNQYHEITNIVYTGFYDNIKVIGADSSLWVFDSVFNDTVSKSIEVYSTGLTNIDVEMNSFINCNCSIGLEKSTGGTWHIMNNLFENGSTGQTAVIYNPATFTHADDPVGAGNSWNNVGTFSTGFDYSRTDGRDANVYVVGNSGREDKKPHFKVNVVDNTSTTTITNGNSFYKAVFTNGTSYTCKWTLENNKYTYQPRNASDVPIWIAGNVQVNQTNRNITIALRKDGVATQISPITVRTTTSGQPYPFGLIAYIPDMVAGSYIEIFVSTPNSSDQVIIQDLTIYADSK